MLGDECRTNVGSKGCIGSRRGDGKSRTRNKWVTFSDDGGGEGRQ